MLLNRRPIAIGLAVILALPASSFGWGARGHRVTARIAQARLTPAAAAAIKDLLNPGDTLVDICNWADNEGHEAVPGSASWHFVNVPIRESRYSDRYCKRGDCVVAKIHHFRKVLADTKAPRRDRQRALLFLVHLVGDVHQPLHVGDHDDRGGNETQVQFFGRGSNLHRVWDTGVIDREGITEAALTEKITRSITAEAVKEWSRGTVEDWATESLEQAHRAYYFPEGASRPIASGVSLSESYERFATPIIHHRLGQAGVRLANELNAIFK